MLNKIILKSLDGEVDFSRVEILIRYFSALPGDYLKNESQTIKSSNNGQCQLNWDVLPADQTDVFLSIRFNRNEIVAQRTLSKDELNSMSSLEWEFNTYRIDSSQLSKAVTSAPSRFIYGRLLELNGRIETEDIQLIFEGRVTPESEFVAFTQVTTETNGYFFIDKLAQTFNAVRVHIGNTKVTSPVDIQLEAAEDGQFRIPSRLIIVAELNADALIVNADQDSCDCGCNELDMHQKRKVLEEFSFFSVVRTTEPEIKGVILEDEPDLTLGDILDLQPSRIAEIKDKFKDIMVSNLGSTSTTPPAGGTPPVTPTPPGGGTPPVVMARAVSDSISEEDVNSAMKNVRISKSVLKEFLKSGKEVNAENLGELLRKNETKNIKSAIEDKNPQLLGRSIADGNHLIQWDGAATIYQAVSVAHGHLLHYKTEWIADGYSLGDLLYSLPLAPGQKKQIVTLGWKRRESAKNAQSLVNEESLRAEIDHDRDVYEITKGGFSESLSGSSSSTTSSASASAGGMIGGVLFGVSGGVGHSSASSSQSGMRNMVASDLQKIQDRISQSASAVRSQRSTVIQTVAQNEELGVETESVANYNHCHAITIQYFEVLRHFKVRHRLADARECVFVPLMMTNFDLEKLLKWRDILSRRLIKPKLAKSFSSAQRVQSEWVGTSLPSATYADDPIIVANGQLAISFVIRRPADIEELVEDFERPIITTAGIVGYYKTKKMVFHEANWESLKPYMGTMTPTTFYSTYLEGKSNKDKIFHDALGQTIAREFVNSLQFSVADDSGRTIAGVNIDASLTSRYQPGGKLHISLRLNEPMAVPRRRFVYLRMTQSKPNIDQSEILVNSGSMRFRTAHYEGTLFHYPNLRDDLSSSDSVSVYCGPSQAELVNPKQEDIDFTNILIDHLNSHIEYYHKQIWLHMSAERRFMLLDGVLLDNPKAEGKSLASLVVNELIGIIGNSMVFPVAPGLNIDPNFTISDSLLDYYMVTGSEPSTISVPTEGVFAEAMMGSCNSCEKIDDSRFWRWEESPIPDSPTSIQTVGTDSRRADPGNLSANPMTNPIVNIQNAPSVPDPSGLNTAINLLGKGDSFRDATGLSSTQANSLAALQASYSATQSISQEAAKLETKRIEEAAKIEKAKLMERRMDKTFNAISNIPGMSDDEKKALYSKAVSSYMGAETAEESNPVKTAEKQVNAAAQTTAAVSKLVTEGKLPKEIGDNVIKDAWKAASNAMDQPKKGAISLAPQFASSADLPPDSSFLYRTEEELVSFTTGKKPLDGTTKEPTKEIPEENQDKSTSDTPAGSVRVNWAGPAGYDTIEIEHSLYKNGYPYNEQLISISKRDDLPQRKIKSMNSSAFENALTPVLNGILPNWKNTISLVAFDSSSSQWNILLEVNPNTMFPANYMANICGMLSLQQMVFDVQRWWRKSNSNGTYRQTIDNYSEWLKWLGLQKDDQPYFDDIFAGNISAGNFVVKPEIYETWENINDDYCGATSSNLMGHYYTSSVIRSYDLFRINWIPNSNPTQYLVNGIWQNVIQPDTYNVAGQVGTRPTWTSLNPMIDILPQPIGYVTTRMMSEFLMGLAQGRFVDPFWSKFMLDRLEINRGGRLNPNIGSNQIQSLGSEVFSLTDTNYGSRDMFYIKNPAGRSFVVAICVPEELSDTESYPESVRTEILQAVINALSAEVV